MVLTGKFTRGSEVQGRCYQDRSFLALRRKDLSGLAVQICVSAPSETIDQTDSSLAARSFYHGQASAIRVYTRLAKAQQQSQCWLTLPETAEEIVLHLL